MTQTGYGTLLLILSVLLFLLPLPTWLMSLTPFWSLLVLYYWVIGLRSPWTWVWLLGLSLILDWLESTVLGVHLCAFTVSLWLPFLDQRLLTHASMERQVAWLMVVCGVYQGVLIVLHGVLVGAVPWEAWIHLIIKVLITAMCWPWFYSLLTQVLNLPAFSRKKVIR
jgi:rod shape-determining protein MreD